MRFPCYVFIRKEGYDEQKFKELGCAYTINDKLVIQCAIFDKSLCWYGDVNFLGYHSADNSIMRIDDAKIAGVLIGVINEKYK